MIAAFVVLLVIALAGGGYIAFDAVKSIKKQSVKASGGAEANAAVAARAEANEVYFPQSVDALAHSMGVDAEDDAREPEAPALDETERGESALAEAEQGEAEPIAVHERVTVQEADALMKDEVAASLIERSEGKTDKTKQGIINIDTLSQCFDCGDVVTLEEIKKRVRGFNKQTTYLKVLARGALDKALTVEADGFSLQAVKMIVLTGGKAIKK